MAIRIYPLKRGAQKTVVPAVMLSADVNTLKLNSSAENLLQVYGSSEYVYYIFDDSRPSYLWIKPCNKEVLKRKKRALNVPAYSATEVISKLKSFNPSLELRKYVFSCSLDDNKKALRVKLDFTGV